MAFAKNGPEAEGLSHDVDGNTIDSHRLTLDKDFIHVADVQGTFTFNQEGVTPNDELFNVFGRCADLDVLETFRRNAG